MKTLKIGNLEIKIPIFQGGMGVGISLGNLAGNVSRCGGVGCISAAQIGYNDKEYENSPLETNLRVLREEIKKAKKIANGGILAVNIMYATKNYERYVKTAVESGADIIISGAGLPLELPELTEGSDVKIIPIISSKKAAEVIIKMWTRKYKRLPDAVIIEGPLAGGHLGFKSEDVLNITNEQYDEEIREIINLIHEYDKEFQCKIPIIVAGGISEKADIERYKKLNVDGYQIATGFIATEECDADIKYKEAFVKCKKEDIVIVKSPVGMPGRAIRNSFTEYVRDNRIEVKKCRGCIKNCNMNTTRYCISQALINAVRGDVENGLVFCGANAYKINNISTVEEVMKEFSSYLA